MGYWREYTRGPDATIGFSWLDQIGYGLSAQEVSERGPSGGTVHVTVKQLAARPITITVRKDGAGECVTEPVLLIADKPAALRRVFVQLAPFVFVKWVDLHGVRSDGVDVTEGIHPWGRAGPAPDVAPSRQHTSPTATLTPPRSDASSPSLVP